MRPMGNPSLRFELAMANHMGSYSKNVVYSSSLGHICPVCGGPKSERWESCRAYGQTQRQARTQGLRTADTIRFGYYACKGGQLYRVMQGYKNSDDASATEYLNDIKYIAFDALRIHYDCIASCTGAPPTAWATTINQIKPELRQTEPAQRRDRPSHGAERNPATQTGSYHNQHTQHHQPQNIQPRQHQRRTTPQSCTARRGLMGKRRHRPISRRNAPPNRSRTRHHLLPRTHHRPQMDTPRTRRTSLKWNNGASSRNTLVPMDATETQTMNYCPGARQ